MEGAVYPRMCNKASNEPEGAGLGPGRGQGSAAGLLHFNTELRKWPRILVLSPESQVVIKVILFNVKTKQNKQTIKHTLS